MKRLGLLLTLLVVAGAGVACDDLESAAVTVNGEETSQSSVDDDLRAIRANDSLAELAEQAGNEIARSPGTIASDVTVGWLSFLVQSELADQELARRDVKVTNADREQGMQQAAQFFGSAEAFDEFSSSFQDQVVDRISALIALQGELGDVAAFQELLASADVDVDPRYGTWSTEQLAVLSPSRT
jgi:hypothetical protein